MGCGTSAHGTSPMGFGAPTVSGVLAPEGSGRTVTGAVAAVEIDPITRDFVVDSTTGSESSMPATDQRVYLCLATLKGTRTSYESEGLATPQAINGDMTNQVQELVRLAMAPVLNDGSATLDTVIVESDNNRLFAAVTWTDVATGIQQPTRQQIGS